MTSKQRPLFAPPRFVPGPDDTGRLEYDGRTWLIYRGATPSAVEAFGASLRVEILTPKQRDRIRLDVKPTLRIHWGRDSGALLFHDEAPMTLVSHERLAQEGKDIPR